MRLLVAQILVFVLTTSALAFFENPPSGETLDDYFENLGRTDRPSVPDRETRSMPGDNFANGTLSTSIGTGADAIRAMVVQRDGSIIGVGKTGSHVSLARFLPDGTLDTSYNGNGKVTTSLGSGTDIAHAAALSSTGQLYLAGRAYNGSDDDYVVARYHTNGTLDTSYNSSGFVLVPIGSSIDIARTIALQADGSLLVAGYSFDGVNFTQGMARLISNGTLDTSFATVGKKTVALTAAQDGGALGICLESNGKIVSAGHAYNSTQWDMVIARFHTDGNFDTTFATTGRLVFSVGTGNDLAFSVSCDTRGRFIIGGSTDSGTNLNFAVVRILSNGTLDTTFRRSGMISQTIGTGDDTAAAIYSQTDGSVVLVGSAYNGSNHDMAIARFLSNGNPDSSFYNAKMLIGVGSNDDFGMGVASLGADRAMLIGGRSSNGSDLDFAVARVDYYGSLATPGSLDRSLGAGGQLTIGQRILALDFQTDGKFVSVGVWSGSFGLSRYFENGTLDTTFFTTGRSARTTFGPCVLIEPDGKILHSRSRLNTNGSFDTSFRTNGGYPNDLSTCPARTSEGNYFLSYDYVVNRYYSSGALDTTFGTTVHISIYSKVGVDAQSRLLVLREYSDFNIEILRYDLAGNIDTSFFTSGKRSLALGSESWSPIQILSPSGDNVFTASKNKVLPLTNTLVMFRFRSDGSADSSFGGAGQFIAPIFYNDAVTAAWMSKTQKIMVVGKSAVDDASDTAFIVRYFSNGAFDTVFGTLGLMTRVIGEADEVTVGKDDLLGFPTMVVHDGSLSSKMYRYFP